MTGWFSECLNWTNSAGPNPERTNDLSCASANYQLLSGSVAVRYGCQIDVLLIFLLVLPCPPLQWQPLRCQIWLNSCSLFLKKKKKKAQTADLHNTVDIIFWGDKMLGTFDDEGSVRACRHMCDNRYIDIHGKRAACLFILRPPWVQCAVCTAGHDSAVFTELWRVQITNANETDYPSSSSPATPPSSTSSSSPSLLSLSLSLSLTLSPKTLTHTVCALYRRASLFSERRKERERESRESERERERAYITPALGNAGEPRRPSLDSKRGKQRSYRP